MVDGEDVGVVGISCDGCLALSSKLMTQVLIQTHPDWATFATFRQLCRQNVPMLS